MAQHQAIAIFRRRKERRAQKGRALSAMSDAATAEKRRATAASCGGRGTNGTGRKGCAIPRRALRARSAGDRRAGYRGGRGRRRRFCVGGRGRVSGLWGRGGG